MAPPTSSGKAQPLIRWRTKKRTRYSASARRDRTLRLPVAFSPPSRGLWITALVEPWVAQSRRTRSGFSLRPTSSGSVLEVHQVPRRLVSSPPQQVYSNLELHFPVAPSA